ncbi:hypothetical protein AB0F36_22180 [Streptomyces sp. NPDC029080]|uniref:hypothetical protein n=1 Tax=Streptomyces sp. NPDC029080 TaxID=3155017 RepID=UPI0033F307C0
MHGEFRDACAHGIGLRGEVTLLLLQADEDRSQSEVVVVPAPRQVGVEVAVSILDIRSLTAQYTLDSAEAGRCS